ncbi:hypothetical protein EX30DRAFT_399348 [Ascodesmis nigricans]|uniref:malate dehydrogenase (oxaloacetate-decarboxylating) n=1 Tax=Ascodesmis nigricans TaxID=341454 RepID=A0A4S2MHZ9_9PEZI|nr:hypothetical protein EX30DRAFT_399348 [Ascodesmis nigricans]
MTPPPHLPKIPNAPLMAKGPMGCALEGRALLNSSIFNKGSAFTTQERIEFKLQGMLPSAVHTLEQQVERAYGQYKSRKDPMARNTFMASMKSQNEVLYYRLVERFVKEMFEVIYTPTESQAIAHYSEIYRRPDGCFLNIHDQDQVEAILAEWGLPEDVDYIVVTDGEEILGIGDQGVGGVCISTAKLVLMTLCGGIHPNRVIPVVLDCGTDNQKLLDDPLYLGLRHKRIRGEEYDRFVDTLVQSVKKLFPRAVLHFEDFGLSNARKLLETYRLQLPCFNDDVQGTGVVTLAAIDAAAHVANLKLEDLRMVIFGAGSAGAGIADQFNDTLKHGGRKKEEAKSQIWLVDKLGLLLESHGDKLTSAQRPYARAEKDWESNHTDSLVDIIREVKPHILIGCSTKAGAFTEEVVREMAKHVDRPIIFPLSNPTKLHEAQPEDIYNWTDGKALVATGSPFPSVKYNGEEYEVAECNNATAFPGIGLGTVLCRAKRVSDKMLTAAVKKLAQQSPALKDSKKGLLPDVTDVRRVSQMVAVAVIQQAVEEGLATEIGIPETEENLEEWVGLQMWEPVYRELKKVSVHGASRAAKGELGIGRQR